MNRILVGTAIVVSALVPLAGCSSLLYGQARQACACEGSHCWTWHYGRSTSVREI